MRVIFLIISLLLLPQLATAQSASGGQPPVAVTVTQTSVTVSVTGTFQTGLAANANRRDCLLQNIGSNVMNIYFGTANTPSLSNSFQLAPGPGVNCADIGGVSREIIQFTGTAGDVLVTAESQ